MKRNMKFINTLLNIDQKTKEHDGGNEGKTSTRPRIMVFDFHSKMLIEVVKALQNRSIEILYWTASKKDFMEIFNDKNLFPNTIFHDANDATAGIPAADINTLPFEPIDQNLVKRFFECEVKSLIMMSNVDRTDVPLMKKIYIYHKYLKYWYGIMTTLKPDAVIFSDVPHAPYKYVAYCLAKYLGIKVLIRRNTQIGGRMFVIDDITDYKELKKQIEANRGINFTLDDLSTDIRDYYKKQQSTDKSPAFYRGNAPHRRAHGLYRFLPSIKAIKKNIKALTFLKTTYLYIQMLFTRRQLPSLEKFIRPTWAIKLQERKWNKIKQEFKREYLQYQTKPDYSKKYVYIPLHNQPERSTLSDGDIFIDQILMIDMVRHAIPKDWVIYVKENKMQWINPRTHTGRFKGYTEEIVAKENTYVVPVETSTFDLIRNSQAVAAVVSTAALEAVLRGKPALVFGHTWYMYCDGVFKVSDLRSVEGAIEKIKAGYKPDQQKIINFLKAVDETTVLGYLNHRTRDIFDLNIHIVKDDKENIKNITDAIYDELME